MAGIGPEWLRAASDRVSENKFETMMMCSLFHEPHTAKTKSFGEHRDIRQL